MIVTINRAEFLDAAKRAASIAPAESPLDVLKGALMEADAASGKLTITSTNMEVALVEKLPCSVQEEGSLVFSAKMLTEMLQRLPLDTVQISRPENQGRTALRSENACYEVDVWDRGTFPKPDLPFPEDTVKLSGIPAMAQRTVFATAQDNNKPLLKCVNLKFTDVGLRAAGSNGSCIVTAKGDDQSKGDISMDELAEMQLGVAAIPVPDAANELADDILCELRKVGVPVSDRKYLNYYPIAQAKAWLSGHSKVESSDLLALKNYLWHLPADREKVENVLNRLCVNPMQDKVNNIRGMALESQEVFDASRGDGSKADVSRKALIKLRNELTRLYQMQCELRSAVQSDSEKAMVDALLEDLEKISRHAHEQTGFTYTSLEEIAVLN